MRPLRLTVEGFRSYRDRAEFDFADRDLVGVVGPTGSGKSSILDALSYALYGRTPTVGNAVSKLVNGRADAAQVELWFTVGDDCLRIARRLGKTSAQSLERWDAVDGSKLETIADKSSDIAAWVTTATGLGFETFARSVLLAQNQFMAMLMATPADGAKTLTGLFGFGVIERMRKHTKELIAGVQAELAAAKEAETAHAAKTESLAEAQAAVVVAERRLGELSALASPLGAFAERIEVATSRRDEATERTEALGRVAGSLPNDAVLDKAISDAIDHEQLLAAAASAEAEAAAALEEASAAVDQAMAADLPGAIAALEAAMATAAAADAQLATAESAGQAALEFSTKASEGLATATAREAEARIAEVEAREGALVATEALAAAESRHAAHVLSEGLAPGDDCPVCARPLDEVPTVETLDDFESLREAARLGTERAESARSSLHAEATAKAVADTTAAQASADLQKLQAAAVSARAAADAARLAVEAAVSGLGAGDEPVDALGSAKSEWRHLGDQKSKATASHSRAAQARSGLAETDVMAGYEATVALHAEAAVAAGIEPAIPGEPSVAAAQLGVLRNEIRLQLDASSSAATVAADELKEIEVERTTLLAGADLADVAAYELAVAGAKDGLAGSRAKAELLAEQVSAGASALERAAEASARALALERLHADLAPGKFPQFLLDEKRRELTAVASEWFRGLSRGRYEFVLEEKRFRVRELSAAGLVRDADTLSGGETFLASLALALGLATMVGMAGGSLEAFFIDEGFGSLDAESLDLAMDGIEELVGGVDGRLVVVVSHVPELRERIEDLIVLGKDEVSGETVVVRS